MPSNLLLGNPVQSYNEGQAIGRQNRFNALAGQAIAAPVDQRSSLIAQAAQADPRQALALNGALSEQDATAEDQRNKTLVNMAKFYVSAPDAAKPQLRAQLAPSLARFGIDATNASPEDFDRTAHAIVEAWTPTNAIPGSLREFNAMTASLSPEDKLKAQRINLGLDARAVTGAAKTGMITGADGRERPYVFDPATRSYKVFDGSQFRDLDQSEAAQLGGGVSAALPPSGLTNGDPMSPFVDQANAAVKAGIPPDLIEQWLASKQGAVASPPAPTTPSAGVGGLGVGRSPEETAAATENAKQGVQLSYLPQTEKIKSDSAVDQARREAEAKANVEAGAKATADARQRQKDAQDTLNLLDEADKILPNATGSAGGRLIDSAAASVGKSTQGAQATAQLQTIAGQLTSKMPRMQGPQSDRDVELYKQMAGDLANPALPVETRRAAARTIRELNQKYATGGGQQSQGSGIQPGHVEDGYRFKGGDPSNQANWEKV